MENSLNGTTVRTGVQSVPGRERLLTKIGDLQTEIGELQEAVVSHAVVDQAIGVPSPSAVYAPTRASRCSERFHSTPTSNCGKSQRLNPAVPPAAR
jgi:hypothetical protein